LPKLADALQSAPASVALVNGRRLKRKGGFKRFQSLIANKVRAAVLRDGTLDTGCGL
jgi:dolichol-phosphate mannosyltransferase